MSERRITWFMWSTSYILGKWVKITFLDAYLPPVCPVTDKRTTTHRFCFYLAKLAFPNYGPQSDMSKLQTAYYLHNMQIIVLSIIAPISCGQCFRLQWGESWFLAGFSQPKISSTPSIFTWPGQGNRWLWKNSIRNTCTSLISIVIHTL